MVQPIVDVIKYENINLKKLSKNELLLTNKKSNKRIIFQKLMKLHISISVNYHDIYENIV